LLIAITLFSSAILSQANGAVTVTAGLSSTGVIQSNPTPTPQPTPPNDYVMDTLGSNYRILNSANTVIYTSTSSSTAFNWLLGLGGHASSGNSVYVQSGAYTVDNTWNIYIKDAKVTFNLGAVLTAVAFGHSGAFIGKPVIKIYDNNVASNVVISGATIDGNGINQEPNRYSRVSGANYNYGISVATENSNSHTVIEYCTVHNVRNYGITAEWHALGKMGVVNCKVYDVGANGIMTDNSWQDNNYNDAMIGSYVTNCEVYNCADVGIEVCGYNTVCTGNYVHDINAAYVSSTYGMYGYGNAVAAGSYWGICVEYGGGTGSGNYFLIAGNTVTRCDNGGIVISQSGMHNLDYFLISGNTLIDIKGSYYAGACLDWSSYSIIEFNAFTNCDVGVGVGYGVKDGSYSTNNIVYGNSFTNCGTNIGNKGTGTTYTQPSVVAVTVTSSPTGVGFVTANGVAGYAGSLSTSPYIFYSTVGQSVNLAANTVSGYTFTSWSDGGAKSHTVTVPSSDAIYTAKFSSGNT